MVWGSDGANGLSTVATRSAGELTPQVSLRGPVIRVPHTNRPSGDVLGFPDADRETP